MLLLLRALNIFNPYPPVKYCCCRFFILVFHLILIFISLMFNFVTFMVAKELIEASGDTEFIVYGVVLGMIIGKKKK